MVVDTLVYEASKLLGNPHLNSVMAIMDAWTACNKLLTQKAKAIRAKEIRPKGIELKKCKLSAPLMYPGDIYCAGANYSDHMQEMARVTGLPPGPNMKELGEMPWHFIKSSRSTIVGPNTKVKIPHYSKMLDWEIELAVVIGKTCSQVLAKDAMKYVAGYTIANDLSARDAMRRPKNPPSSPFHMDWIGQKCFDGACPLGPYIGHQGPYLVVLGLDFTHIPRFSSSRLCSEAMRSGHISRILATSSDAAASRDLK